MRNVRDVNPLPEVPAGGLGMPAYTNAAVGQAVAECRRDGDVLLRVTAVYERTGERFGYDLPPSDAESMARDLTFNQGYLDVTLCKIR